MDLRRQDPDPFVTTSSHTWQTFGVLTLRISAVRFANKVRAHVPTVLERMFDVNNYVAEGSKNHETTRRTGHPGNALGRTPRRAGDPTAVREPLPHSGSHLRGTGGLDDPHLSDAQNWLPPKDSSGDVTDGLEAVLLLDSLIHPLE